MKFQGRRKRKKVFVSTNWERVNFGRYISDTKKKSSVKVKLQKNPQLDVYRDRMMFLLWFIRVVV